MTKLNYVTLFNSAYLNRGLLLYESLKAVSRDFSLYVVCFDESTYTILKALNYDQLFPISLKDFEDEKLLKVKSQRTPTEYCWTCSASVIWYCFKTYQLANCIYVDADMYFYSNPESIWNEDSKAEVMITSHNYSKAYDQSKVSGQFCVQFVGFKNTENALLVLKEWRENCINWCYNRIEDGKFGDQKYLDVWPEKYPFVHVIQNPTAGLAPWNIQQFRITTDKQVWHKKTFKSYQPIFYHFHKLRQFSMHRVSLTSSYYSLNKGAMENFYFPYSEKLIKMDRFLSNRFKGIYSINYAEPELKQLNLLSVIKLYFYYLKQSLKNFTGKTVRERWRNDYIFEIKA